MHTNFFIRLYIIRIKRIFEIKSSFIQCRRKFIHEILFHASSILFTSLFDPCENRIDLCEIKFDHNENKIGLCENRIGPCENRIGPCEIRFDHCENKIGPCENRIIDPFEI